MFPNKYVNDVPVTSGGQRVNVLEIAEVKQAKKEPLQKNIAHHK